MGSKKKRESHDKDSTMEVETEELHPRQPDSLEQMLDDLEDEVQDGPPPMVRPKSSIPPPLPPGRRSNRPPSIATPQHASNRPPRASAPPPPPRKKAPPIAPPQAPPLARSAPPPAPKNRVRGLGRPATLPPPRSVPTASGVQSPLPATHELSGETTLVVAGPQGGGPPLSAEAATQLLDEWKAELELVSEPGRLTRLHFELGRLYEGPLDDAQEALRSYEAALKHQREHVPSLRGARRCALALKSYRSALPFFDIEARVTRDSRQKAALLYAKGRLLEDSLGDPDQARRAYQTAAELDRDSPSVLKALEQRDRAGADFGQLERTLEREANAVARDPRHRAALVIERARVLEHHAGNIDGAVELYETALRLDPDAEAALEALERLCHAEGRWRDLIAVLARRAESSADPAEKALALYRVGRLHAERLGNRDEAAQALSQAAEHQPNDPLILEELSALLERGEQWDKLAAVLKRLAEVSTDPASRLSFWHRVGVLYDERLSASGPAREAFEKARALSPTHLPTLQALSRIYAAAEAWDELVAMLLAEAEEATDDKRRASAHARVGEVLELRKNDAQGAVDHHVRALSLLPGFAPSFKALARLYRQAGLHRKLVELYESAVELADEPAAAITHLFRIGALYEDALSEHGQAAHTYRRILEIDGENLGALHSLQRATERAGRYAELVEALEREAQLRTDDKRIVDLLHRAAEVLDEQLADPEGAMSHYRRVLEIDGGYAPALAGLGRILYRAGRWEDLLELYERELELNPSGAPAAALLHKMGELAEERIGDEARAIDCYKRALDIDARHRPSIASLSRRLMARRDWSQLTQILELELDGLSDPQAKARAAFRLGEVFEQHVGAPDRAAGAYETALVAVPGYPPALAALARLRAAQGAWRRLVDQLEEEAARSENEDRSVARLARAGRLWSVALNDPRRAVGCYERALEIAPNHLESLLALEHLYRKLSRHDALRRVYGAQARVLGDPRARVAALRELSRSSDPKGEDSEERRQVLMAILSLSPDDPGALEGLEALALRVEDRDLLIQIDERLASTASDAKVASTYQTRLAESLEARGDASALDAYRAALDSDPESFAAARGLSRVALALGDPEVRADAARREAGVTLDPRAGAKLLVEAASIAESELGDPEGALADYERALEKWPDDANAAAGLTSLLLAEGRAAQAADRLARAAQSASSPDRVSALWMEVARLQGDLLDNPSGALSSLARVLKESPQHVPTLRRTAELQGRQGRWTEAARTLATVVSLAPDRDVLRAAHLELAKIWDEELDDPPRALVSLQAVIALDDSNAAALRRLASLSARTGDPAKAATTLRRLVESSEGADRAAALIELSRVEALRGDEDASRAAAVMALTMEGPGSAAAEYHRSIIASGTDWEEHRQALRAWLHGSSDPLSRRAARLEMGRILLEELSDPSLAVAELEKAVREQPTDIELRLVYARYLRAAGQAAESVTELRRLIREHPDRAVLYRELAETLHTGGDTHAARRALAPLAYLQEATPKEQAEVGRRPRNTALAHPGSLDASILEAFYPVRRVPALVELQRWLMPGIAKLYPADLEAYGVSGRQRLTTRSEEPIRRLADRVAGIFGVADFHLYVHRGRGTAVAVELSEPPSIMLHAGLMELSEAHQVFALARAMSDIAVGLYAVDKLTPRELEIVLGAASRRVSSGFAAGLTAEDTLEDIGKRVYKGLPRRARKRMEELAEAYVAAEPVDFADFVNKVSTAAQRLALITCDDLGAAIDVVQRTERDLASLQGKELLRHPTIARLVRFWVSKEADAVRSRCGIHTAPAAQVG